MDKEAAGALAAHFPAGVNPPTLGEAVGDSEQAISLQEETNMGDGVGVNDLFCL